MILSHIIRIFRHIIIIASASYLIGLMWYIVSDLDLNGLLLSHLTDTEKSNFIYEYNLEVHSVYAVVIELSYYSFTTLSTVGLGDFHPKSNTERVFCSIFMLFGAMTTSIMIESFSQAIKEI